MEVNNPPPLYFEGEEDEYEFEHEMIPFDEAEGMLDPPQLADTGAHQAEDASLAVEAAQEATEEEVRVGQSVRKEVRASYVKTRATFEIVVGDLPKPKVGEKAALKKLFGIPVISSEKIVSTEGLPYIKKHFSKLCFRGKGFEVEDLQTLLAKYREWCHFFHPKDSFEAAIEKISSLGSKEEVKVFLKSEKYPETTPSQPSVDINHEFSTFDVQDSNFDSLEVRGSPPSEPNAASLDLGADLGADLEADLGADLEADLEADLGQDQWASWDVEDAAGKVEGDAQTSDLCQDDSAGFSATKRSFEEEMGLSQTDENISEFGVSSPVLKRSKKQIILDESESDD